MTRFRCAAALTLALASCPSQGNPPDARLNGPPPSLDVAREMAESSNAFGLDLYGHLRQAQGNLLFSPYSISLALGMSLEGARGGTEAQMQLALHQPGDRPTDGYRDLGVLVESGSEALGRDDVMPFELAVANRLWADEQLPLEDGFAQRMATVFGAPIETVDFGSPDRVRSSMNRWVSKRTRGRIENIVPKGLPSPQSKLALANAVYFKARWMEEFYKSRTVDTPFRRVGAAPVDVRMMHQLEHFRYGESGDAQWLSLPYMGGDCSMVVVLPRAADGISQLEAGFDAEAFTAGIDALKSRRVNVALPRFEFESAFSLKIALVALGMEDAFSAQRADFSGIAASEGLCLEAVVHKTFIAVDEEGTEAAAVTMSLVASAQANPPEPASFVADHPFLFFIRHNRTGALLFMGRVMDPSVQ